MNSVVTFVIHSVITLSILFGISSLVLCNTVWNEFSDNIKHFIWNEFSDNTNFLELVLLPQLHQLFCLELVL